MTSLSWPTAVIAALIGAATALAVTSLFTSPPPPPGEFAAKTSQPASPASRSDAGAATDVALALEALSSDVRELTARVESLERQPAPDTRVALSRSPELDMDVAARSSEAALAPEAVQESVAAALETIRADERAKAEVEREQRELERLEERLTRLNERLGLSPDQTNMMRALMLAQNTQREELDRLREQGVEREQRRLVAEEAERRRTVELARILTPEQLASLRELESNRGDDRGRTRRGSPSGASNGANNSGTGGGGRRGR